MLLLASFLSAAYAFVNAFGAWMVVRRKGWLALFFMVAAALLIIAAAAFNSAIPFARVLLVLGLVTASVSSYLNASLVLGRVNPLAEGARLLVAIGIYLVAHIALS